MTKPQGSGSLIAALRGRLRANRSADGFTMIELLVTIVIAGVLASIGSVGVLTWRNNSEQQGSAQEVASQLRNVVQRSVSEGRTYCVAFAPTRSYAVMRRSCGSTGSAVGAVRTTQSSRVTIEASVSVPGPALGCPIGTTCVYFSPRGTATAATILVRSSARSNVYTVQVEGLTSRVSL